MKITLSTAYFDTHRGGVEIAAGCLARELQALGVEIVWVACNATPPAPAFQCTPVPIAAWNVTEERFGLPFPIPSALKLRDVWRATKATHAALVHDTLYLTNIVTVLAARWHRIPIVVVQHIAHVPYQSPLLRLLMSSATHVITRSILKAADKVVFISASVANHFSDVAFKSPPMIIFNGVDISTFHLPEAHSDKSELRRQFGLPNDRDVVLFVGRFVEKKGLHLIERIARCRPTLTFAFAGWGPIDPHLWELPNVHVLSNLRGPALTALYHASTVLLLPSIGEGFPLVIQEALACGLPVICNSDTGAGDPGASDLLHCVPIDFADSDGTLTAILQRLDEVLATPLDAVKTASIARHLYAERVYSWHNAAQTYHSILHSIREARKAIPGGCGGRSR